MSDGGGRCAVEQGGLQGVSLRPILSRERALTSPAVTAGQQSGALIVFFPVRLDFGSSFHTGPATLRQWGEHEARRTGGSLSAT